VADALAKQAATSAFVVGIKTATVSTEIRCWANKEHQGVWESAAGYRQSRLFLKGPDKKLARYALGLSRQHLCVLTGLLTLNITARHSILGSHFLRLDELRCIQPHALMRFARGSKRLK